MCFSGGGGQQSGQSGSNFITNGLQGTGNPIFQRIGGIIKYARLRGLNMAGGLGRSLASGDLKGGVKSTFIGATNPSSAMDDNT